MLIAACITAGATVLIGFSSLWAIITWRENRQREQRESIQERTLEAARKEFAAKDSVDNRTILVVVGAIVGVLLAWDKLTGKTD
jgi:hypothetical protein